MNQNKSEFDSRKYLAESQKVMRDIVIERDDAFAAAGNGSKIKPLPLDDMSVRYLAGDLDQKAV